MFTEGISWDQKDTGYFTVYKITFSVSLVKWNL